MSGTRARAFVLWGQFHSASQSVLLACEQAEEVLPPRGGGRPKRGIKSKKNGDNLGSSSSSDGNQGPENGEREGMYSAATSRQARARRRGGGGKGGDGNGGAHGESSVE